MIRPGTVMRVRLNSTGAPRTFTLGLDGKWRSGVWFIDRADFFDLVEVMETIAS